MTRRVDITLPRALVTYGLGIVAGVQVALFLSGHFDDGVAEPLSGLIGISFVVIGAAVTLWPYRDRAEKDLLGAQDGQDVLDLMKYMILKQKAHAPGLDNIHGLQKLFEVSTVHDWAESRQESDPPVNGIMSNSHDPPDVLAKMGCQKIGIEVTRLVSSDAVSAWEEKNKKANETVWEKLPDAKQAYKKQVDEADNEYDERVKEAIEEYEKAKARAAAQYCEQLSGIRKVSLPYEGGSWSEEEFRTCLTQIVKKKEGDLRKQFLLISTAEPALDGDVVKDYLAKIGPLQYRFDQVFIMADYKADPDDGHYPVFEVCKA